MSELEQYLNTYCRIICHKACVGVNDCQTRKNRRLDYLKQEEKRNQHGKS